MIRDRGALVLAAVLTAITGVLLIASMSLQATAAIVPLVVAVPTVLVLIEQLVREVRRREVTAGAAPPVGLERADTLPGRERGRIERGSGQWLVERDA